MGGRSSSGFASKVGAAFDSMRSELAADPTFIDSYGNDLEHMRTLVTAPHVKSPNDLVDVFVGGAAGMVIPSEESRYLKEDTYMYAGLKLLRAVAFDQAKSHHKHSLVMADGQASVVYGNLTFDASVRLGAQSSLVVLGDLTVKGALHAEVWYSRVAVGGTLSIRSGITEGELIAGEAIRVDDLLYLYGTDVSCRAPVLKGNDVLVDDKYNRFTSIEVASFVDFRGPGGRDKARAMFGDLLDSDGSIEKTRVLARIGA